MDVRTKAITQAVRLLNAAHAQFKIISENGEEFGELEIVAAKTRTRRHNVFAASGYIPKIEAMQVGDVEVLESPETEDVKKFRSAVCGCAGRVFGNGNYTTLVNGNTIELLRVH